MSAHDKAYLIGYDNDINGIDEWLPQINTKLETQKKILSEI